MSQSIKLNDNTFIDTEGVYDHYLGKTQYARNSELAYIRTLRKIDYTELPSQSTNTETYFHEWLDYWIGQGVFNENTVYIAPVRPNGQGWCIGFSTASGSYAGFTYQAYGDGSGKLIRFGKEDNTWFFTMSTW